MSLGDFGAGDVQKRLCEVQVGNKRVVDAAGFGDTRPTDEQWSVKAFLVHPAFVEPTVFPEPEALIRAVDDNCIFREAGVIEEFKHTADIFIHRLYTT